MYFDFRLFSVPNSIYQTNLDPISYNSRHYYNSFKHFLYYLFKKRITRFFNSSKDFKKKRYLIEICFVSLVLLQIFILYINPATYERPILFIFLFICSLVVVIFNIFYLDENKFNFQVFLKIPLLAMIWFLSQFLLYPTFYEVDGWGAMKATNEIIYFGHIPEYFISYFTTSIMHQIIGITSLICHIDYKTATILSISFQYFFIIPLFIVLVGKILFNYKLGIMAAFFLAFSNNFNAIPYWMHPFSFASIFLVIILYLIFKEKLYQINFFLIAITCSILLVFSHQLTSLAMIIIVFLLIIGVKTYSNIFDQHQAHFPLIFYIFLILFWVGWMAHSYTNLNFIAAFLDKDQLSGGEILASFGGLPLNYLSYSYPIKYYKLFFNSIGYITFFVISIVGIFYMFSPKRQNRNIFLFAVVALNFLALAFFSEFISSVFNTLVIRWQGYAAILLSIPFAVSLSIICSSLKTHLQKILVFLIIASLVISLMIMSANGNIDRPLFSETKRPIQSYTTSELAGISTILSYKTTNLIFDHLAYFWPVESTEPIPAEKINTIYPERSHLSPDTYFYKDFNFNKNSLIFVRNSFFENTITIHNLKQIKLNYDPESYFERYKYLKMYSSNAVRIYFT
jgi:hypothetical protein